MSEKMLITVDQVNPIEIFVNKKYGVLLEFIKNESTIENPTTETKKGRDLIRTMAAQVASSKVFIVDGGKKLADAEKKKIADTLEAMNTSKKFIEDCLVYRKAEVREPLTKWEAEEKAKEEAQKLLNQIKEDHGAALLKNAELDRQRKIEAENKRLKEEATQRQAEDIARKKIENEQKTDREAETEKRIKAEQETERLKQKAIDDANQAEIDKQNAVNEERLQIQIEKDNKKKADDARAADTAHRKKINNEALSSIDDILARDYDPKLTPGQQIIIAIAKGEIPNVTINY